MILEKNINFPKQNALVIKTKNISVKTFKELKFCNIISKPFLITGKGFCDKSQFGPVIRVGFFFPKIPIINDEKK